MTPTVAETLDRVLEHDPGRLALEDGRSALTYEELDRSANAAAAALAAMGVAAGDRVAASLPNQIDIVVAFHGAMRLGAIWVGVNRALAPAEKQALLAAAEPAVFLAEPPVAAEHLGADWQTVTVDPGDETQGWRAALAAATGADRPPRPDPRAPAAIAFTSGTTGLPKGIVHSQQNLLLPAAALVSSRGYDHTLRKGDCLPLTILNLQVLTTLLTSAAGGCCVLTDRRDAAGIAEWIEKEAVTVWNGVPAQFYSLVREPQIRPEQLSSLREVWTGGAPCPEELFEQFRDRFGVPLRQTYGLTEAPTVVTMEEVGSPRVAGSSGRPLPHLEVTIRDGDGRSLAGGEVGEICVSATGGGSWAGAYRTYLGLWWEGSVEPNPAPEVLRTGDVGNLDADGNLFVRDRKNLVIIRGGANVYPAEVERVLEAAPGVRAAAVLGIADDRLGQRVVACIEPEPSEPSGPGGEEAILEHCRSQLARYKVPERIIFVAELPRNAMGKIQRQPLMLLFEADQ